MYYVCGIALAMMDEKDGWGNVIRRPSEAGIFVWYMKRYIFPAVCELRAKGI